MIKGSFILIISLALLSPLPFVQFPLHTLHNTNNCPQYTQTGVGKIVVFDSGLGSLSVINAIREATLSNMIYFADQRYFPYGVRSVQDLRKIITERIAMLEEKFKPEMIIVGSNTPTLLLGKLPAEIP